MPKAKTPVPLAAIVHHRFYFRCVLLGTIMVVVSAVMWFHVRIDRFVRVRHWTFMTMPFQPAVVVGVPIPVRLRQRHYTKTVSVDYLSAAPSRPGKDAARYQQQYHEDSTARLLAAFADDRPNR